MRLIPLDDDDALTPRADDAPPLPPARQEWPLDPATDLERLKRAKASPSYDGAYSDIQNNILHRYGGAREFAASLAGAEGGAPTPVAETRPSMVESALLGGNEAQARVRLIPLDEPKTPRLIPLDEESTSAKVDRFKVENPGFLNRRGQDLEAGLRNMQAATNANDLFQRSREVRLFAALKDSEDPVMDARRRLNEEFGPQVGSEVFQDLQGDLIAFAEADPAGRQAVLDKFSGRMQESLAGVRRRLGQAAEIPDNPALTDVAEAESFSEGFDRFTDAPLEATGAGIARSAAPMGLSIALGLATGPIGFGAGSFIAERNASILEGLNERGVDIFDDKAVLEALNDPEIVDAISRDATTRAAVIGFADALSAGIGGRALGAATNLGRAARQTGAGAGLGAGGEAGAQLATEGEITRPGEVLLEGALEGPTQSVEVGTAAARDIAAGRRGADDVTGTTTDEQPEVNVEVDLPEGAVDASTVIGEEVVPPTVDPDIAEQDQLATLDDEEVAQGAAGAATGTSPVSDTRNEESGAPAPGNRQQSLSQDEALAEIERIGIRLSRQDLDGVLEEVRAGRDPLEAYLDRAADQAAYGDPYDPALDYDDPGVVDSALAKVETERVDIWGDDPFDLASAPLPTEPFNAQAENRPEEAQGGGRDGEVPDARGARGIEAGGRQAQPVPREDGTVDETDRALNDIRRGTVPPEPRGPNTQPIINDIIRRGGVDPDSPLASELRARDLRRPGLYRRGGMKSLDDFQIAENPELLARFAAQREETGESLTENQALELIDEELGGNPITRGTETVEEGFTRLIRSMQDALDEARLDINEFSNAEIREGLRLLDRGADPEEIADTLRSLRDQDGRPAENEVREWSRKALRDFVRRKGTGDGLPVDVNMKLPNERKRRGEPRNVKVQFADNVDKALFLTHRIKGRATEANRKYRQFLADQGFTSDQIDRLGAQVAKRVVEGARKGRKGVYKPPRGLRTRIENERQAEAPKPATPRVPRPVDAPAPVGVTEEGSQSGSVLADAETQRKVIDALQTEQTDQGEQTVIPGAERRTGEALTQQMRGRSRSDAPQDMDADGIFDEGARNQGELLDPNVEITEQVIIDDNGDIRYAPAFHGTPHQFDRFDIGKVGTGEGHQAFGWGLYFTSRFGIAEHYRKALVGKPLFDLRKINQRVYDILEENMWSIASNVTPYDVNIAASNFTYSGQPSWMEDETADALRSLNLPKPTDGAVYAVDLAPQEDEYLLWDVPLRDQSEKVKRALDALPPETWEFIEEAYEQAGYGFGGRNDSEYTGADFYHDLTRDLPHETLPNTVPGSDWMVGDTTPKKHTSLYLHSIGIPGIKYLDADSRSPFEVIYPNGEMEYFGTEAAARAAAEGRGGIVNEIQNRSHNYVIFDDKLIEITDRLARAGNMTPDPKHLDFRAVADAVTAEARRIGLGGIIDRLNLAPYVQIGDQRVLGAYDRGENVISVALMSSGGMEEAVRTLRHEGLHAMRHMGVITPDEWQVLTNKAQSSWRKKYDVDSRWGELLANDRPDVREAKLIEEAVAEAFADHVSGKKQPGRIGGIFKRMAQFIEALGNALRGLGFRSHQQVFDALDRGDRRPDPANAPVDPHGDMMLLPMNAGTGRNNGHIFGPVFHESSAYVSRILHNKNRSQLSQYLAVFKAAKDVAMQPDRDRMDALKAATAMSTMAVRRGLQDAFIDLRNVQDILKRRTGLNHLPEHLDAYLAQTLYRSRSGARVAEIQERFIDPLLETMSERGINLEDLELYLAARHARERNEFIRQRNPDFDDAGSGMTDAQADQALASFADRREAMEAAAAHIDALLAYNREKLVSYGLMTRESVQVWEEMFRHYVPLRGRDFDEHRLSGLPGELSRQNPSRGSGFSVSGKESPRAEGRGEDSPAVNIVSYAITMTETTIIRGEKNRVGQALYNLIRQNPDPELWSIEKGDATPDPMGEVEGAIQARPDDFTAEEASTVARTGQQTIKLKINGQEVALNIRQADIARAFTQMSADTGSIAIRLLQSVNNWLSQVNTALNPEFMISNFARDLQAAFINMSDGDLMAIRNQTIKDLKPAFGVLTGLGRQDPEWQRFAEEFRKDGGRIQFFGLNDVEKQARILRKQFDIKTGQATAAKPREVMGKVFQSFEKMNSGVENAIRLSAYVNARRNGFSRQKAAETALNLTVNFNRKGSHGQLLNALYLFYNASIQGNVRMMQALYHSPRVRKIVGTVIVAGFINDMLNGLLAPEDDDGDNSWDREINEWEKSTNMMFMVGNGEAIKIPMPYGYNFFWNIGRNFSAAVRRQAGWGSGKKPMVAAMDLTLSMFDTFNPIGGSESIVNWLAPTVADPVIDLALNRDFAGRPITPEQPPFAPAQPQSQLYWNNTGQIPKAVTDFLNDISGGDEYRPGVVDFSPEHMEYAYEFVTGSAGAFWSRNAEAILTMASGEVPETRNVSFVRRLYRDKSEWMDQTRFYERKAAIDQAVTAFEGFRKAGKWDEAKDVRAEHRRMIRLKPLFDRTKKALQENTKQRQAIEASDRSDKQDLLDRNAEAKKRILDRANAAYNRLDADEEERLANGVIR